MIARKKCKICCVKFPSIGLQGHCWLCCPDEIKEKYKSKKDLARKNKNNRMAQASKLRKFQNAEDSLLNLWFMSRRLEMVGTCANCGGKTSKDDAKYYRWNIAHLVPKSLCKSVATNFLNWQELCALCHYEFDSTFSKAVAMKCFSEAKRKFGLFQHLIPPDELRRVNPALLTDSDNDLYKEQEDQLKKQLKKQCF